MSLLRHLAEGVGIRPTVYSLTIIITVSLAYLINSSLKSVFPAWYYDEWWMMNDIWWMIYDIWYMIYDEWYMMNDIWYMIYDIWYMIYDEWWMMNHE